MSDNSVSALRLPCDDRTLSIMSELFVQEHIFKVLDMRVKTFIGAHRLFKNIENGYVRVYGAFFQDRIIGVCFGNIEPGTSDFCTHLAFLRHSKALEGCFACAAAMVADYAKEGIIVQSIVGYIPEHNKAALRIARFYGCKDYGIDKTKTIVENCYEIPCRVMKKELK